MISKLKKKVNAWVSRGHIVWMYRSVCMALLLIGIGFICIGYKIDSYNSIFVGIMFLWLNNILYACGKLKERIVFLFFNITLALFTLTKPFFRLWNGDSTYLYRFATTNMDYALKALWMTLLAMFAGVVLYQVVERLVQGRILCHKKPGRGVLHKLGIQEKEVWLKSLRLVAEIVFYVSFCCYFVLRMEEYLFVRNGDYLDYYTSFKSQLPYIVYVISTFMKYGFAIFLATLPSKKRTFLPSVLYVVSALPSLLVGMRNPIAQNVIFVFLYYFIRDALKDKQKWIGKIEKGLVILGVPFAVVFFAVYSYIRSNLEIAAKGIWELVFGFLEGQGVTFEVLNIAHGCIPYLPQRAVRNYTFGGFLDYFLHGTIAQKLFGASALPSGNNLIMALESNSFAHNMSYIAMGQTYLDGRGWGSSYLLEVFTDYGYIGIVIFSAILGAFMIFMIKKMGKGVFSTAFFLLCLMNLFFVPRASATGWLDFILTAQCWVSVFTIVGGSYILTRIKQYVKIKNKSCNSGKGVNTNA